MPCASNQLMSVLIKPDAQSFSPISPATTGTDAARLFCGSVGLFASHCDRSFEKASPPSISTFVAPVARTVLISVCIPATAKPTPEQAPDWGAVLPLSQQDQLTSCGSLYRSKITEELLLNVLATDVQKAGA